MRISLLGPLTITDSHGQSLPLPGSQGRALLTLLAHKVGWMSSNSQLIAALWPEEDPETRLNALHTQVSRLRKIVGDRIQSSLSGYTLIDVTTDIDQFRSYAAQGRRHREAHDCHSAEESFTQALSLWRGEPLADVANRGFADSLITGLVQERRDVASQLIDVKLALGRAAELLPELSSALATDPWDERVTAQYMRALGEVGQQTQAMEVFERTRKHLSEELGIDPSPRLAQAHLDVLRGQPGPAPAQVMPTEDWPESNFPVAFSSLLGREDDLANLTRRLEHERLVVLTGPGGVGKTRLALEVGSRVAAQGSLAARLVELAAVSDPDQVPFVVLSALRQGSRLPSRHGEGEADAMTRLRSTLREWPVLLVIDNCEHLLRPVARLVRELLAHCPRLRILATSRQPFTVPGELVFPVAPMPYPQTSDGLSVAQALEYPAVALLVSRAQSSMPDFALTEENAADVVRICTGVDGLPLALELASARLRTMTPADLVARLDRRLQLLSAGDSSAQARQRTLRAVVDWSWDLLTATERELLARMSVFSGSATLEAVESVCAGDAEVLGELVDKSLVTRLSGGRYRLLEIIREYAAQKLSTQDGEPHRMHIAHADFYLGVAKEAEPELMTRKQVGALERLAADHDNFMTAIQRMINLDEVARAYELYAPLTWYMWMRGHRLEGMRLAQVLWDLGTVEGAQFDPRLTASQRVRIGQGGTWGIWDGTIEAKAILPRLREAAKLAEEYQLEDSIPSVKMTPLMIPMMLGDSEAIFRLSEDLMDDPNTWIRGMGHFFRACFAGDNVTEVERERLLLASVRIFEKLGERFGLILSLAALGEMWQLQGRVEAAREVLQRARATEAQFGAPPGDSVVTYSLWILMADNDDPATVMEEIAAQRQLAWQVGNTENIVATDLATAICLRRLGRWRDAQEVVRRVEHSLSVRSGTTDLWTPLRREQDLLAAHWDAAGLRGRVR
ncbi:BTAD domain-containing putative transcriptional regulator [Natronoglycomyces albus]|uniref:Winged helix-turn-helix domain-containing protein n=1 Tax=Natronoglycomyces albus TaxID=2811108 RepID=A0A895XUX3_9ACTN|nr:BTAD domain-containing putative transcriptional regulator [Natronoglycomyces albus]QSB06326.1 winged helix-turn-helix domain-containing protein [Natronoglycomyces albus]